MDLTSFVKSLWENGSVVMPETLTPFSENDLKEVVWILHRHYEQDRSNMPGEVPAFHPEAGVWGAAFLYRALQFTLLRDSNPEEIRQYLNAYEGTLSAEVIYSADLSLRYLPVVFNFAKGLSPEDVLVQYLTETATAWPFSSVGVELAGVPVHTFVLHHPALKQAYIDRIVYTKDNRRASLPEIKPLIAESLGIYSEILWPEFRLSVL